MNQGNFGGWVDDTAVDIGEDQASQLTNFYKRRRLLRRRNGQAALGAASLSPDQNLQMLSWQKIGSVEHLLAVHNTNVVDLFGNPVGGIVGNGTGKMAGGGDAHAAWVEGKVYIGNGVSQNVRYNGKAQGFAAGFAATAGDYLYVANNGLNIFTGQDLTVGVWFYLNSLTGGGTFDEAIVSMWDRATSSNRSWMISRNFSSGRFRFSVYDGSSTGTVDATSVTVATGQWYFIVVRHDKTIGQLSIQVNGGTVHTAAWATGFVEPTIDFRVGGVFLSVTTGSETLNGRVGPVGIWRTAMGGGGALSNATMLSLYNNGDELLYADLTTAEKVALKGWWDMQEASGTRDDATTTATTYNLLQHGTVGTAAGAGGALAVAMAMVDKGSPPTLNGQNSGVLVHGTYRYRVSFLNADGIYGEASDPLTVDVGVGGTPPNNTSPARVNLTIPTFPADQDGSGRILWRMDPTSSVYQLVTTFNDNTTTNFDDNVKDLGVELVDFNTRMPPCKYLWEHQSRLIGAGCTTSEGDLRTLFVSNRLEPYYCPLSPDLDDPNQGTRAKLQGPGAGEIIGGAAHGGVSVVFTGGAGFVLLGDAAANFAVHQFCAHGCTAHRTIQSVRSLLLWLAPDGVYAWSGQLAGENVTRISDDIRSTIDALTAAQMAGAHAFVWENRYYLCWDSGCVYYDLDYKIWGQLTNSLWRASTVTAFVSSARQRIYAAREGHARVYQLETGNSDAIPAAGTAIVATWAGRDWDMGLPGHEKRVHLVEAKFRKAVGTAKITLYRGSGEAIQTFFHDMSQTDHPDDTVSRMLESVGEAARDEHFRLKAEVSSVDPNTELLAAGLMYTLAL